MLMTLKEKYQPMGRPPRLRRGGSHLSDNRNNQAKRKKTGPKTYIYGSVVYCVVAETGRGRWVKP